MRGVSDVSRSARWEETAQRAVSRCAECRAAGCGTTSLLPRSSTSRSRALGTATMYVTAASDQLCARRPLTSSVRVGESCRLAPHVRRDKTRPMACLDPGGCEHWSDRSCGVEGGRQRECGQCTVDRCTVGHVPMHGQTRTFRSCICPSRPVCVRVHQSRRHGPSHPQIHFPTATVIPFTLSHQSALRAQYITLARYWCRFCVVFCKSCQLRTVLHVRHTFHYGWPFSMG